MSKEVSDLYEDQEFAFSKYLGSSGRQTASNVKPHNTASKNHKDTRLYNSQGPLSAEDQSSTEIIKGIGPTDLSDLFSLHEDLHTIISAPLHPPHLAEGFFYSPSLVNNSSSLVPEQQTRFEYSTLRDTAIELNPLPASSKRYLHSQNDETKKNLDLIKSTSHCCENSDWSRTDAELLTRCYENSARSSSTQPAHDEDIFNARGNEKKVFNPGWDLPHRQSNILRESITTQNSVFAHLQNSTDEFYVLQKEGKFKEYPDLFWQRLNEVINSLLRQVELYNSNLVSSYRQETFQYQKFIENQLLQITELLMKIEAPLEKIKYHKKSSHNAHRTQEQDLKSVLFSIDQDILRTFGCSLEDSP